MSDDTDKLLDDEPQDADDELDEDLDGADEDEDSAEEPAEDPDEEDDLLEAPKPASAPKTGGGGLIWAIVILLVVAVAIAYGVSLHLDSKAEKAKEAKDALEQTGHHLASIRGKIDAALDEFDAQDEPDVDGLIGELNSAARDLVNVGSSTNPIGTDEALDVAQQIADLQGKLRQAITQLREDQKAYEETVQAAKEALKAATQTNMTPIANNLGTLSSAAIGDASTPVSVGSRGGDDEDDADNETADDDIAEDDLTEDETDTEEDPAAE